MRGNFHVRFLGEVVAAMPLPYPTRRRFSWGGQGVSKNRPFTGLFVRNPFIISDVFMVNYVSSKRPFPSPTRIESTPLQPSDTAYPRFKSRPSATELESFYTPSEDERAFCDSHTRSQTTRLGFVLLLKTYQRLGYFVTSEQVPDAIVEHIAAAVNEPGDREALRQYDSSQARRKHLSAVREFLDVKPFDEGGKALMRNAFREAALTKEDVIDLINIGIETLVRDRYELPAFDTLEREARVQRVATNQELFAQVNRALGDAGRSLLDSLFVVGDDPRRVSPWNDLKQDPAKPTLGGMRKLVARYDQLTGMAGHAHLLKAIPVVKVRQWALEGGQFGCRQHGRHGTEQALRGSACADLTSLGPCDRRPLRYFLQADEAGNPLGRGCIGEIPGRQPGKNRRDTVALFGAGNAIEFRLPGIRTIAGCPAGRDRAPRPVRILPHARRAWRQKRVPFHVVFFQAQALRAVADSMQDKPCVHQPGCQF